MELPLESEAALLRDSVRRFMSREYGFEARQQRRAQPDGFCRQTWASMADLGFVSAALPPAAGGFGFGALGTLIIAEACGGALVVEPWLATGVLGAGALELAGSAVQRELLPAVSEGRCLLAFAEGHLAITGDWHLGGQAHAVLHAAAADWFVVAARIDAGPAATPAALLLVPAASPGLRLHRYTTPDGLPAADLDCDGVQLGPEALLGTPEAGPALLERLHDRASAALCAEAVGAMDALLSRTITYLGTRQQFGVALGQFQALRHRVADLAIELEQARSMALVAALHADDEDAASRQRHVSAAHACVARAAREVGQQALQLHGGIGMTDALDVSHYFRRLTMITQAGGDEGVHLDRYLEASGR